jgi:succinyl-CoA synthetase alpha subunit
MHIAQMDGLKLERAAQPAAAGLATARAVKVIPNAYRDSIVLMQLSATLAKLPGVTQASALMGLPANLALLQEAKLHDGPIEAGLNDLVIVIAATTDAHAADAMEVARQALHEREAAGAKGTMSDEMPPRSVAMALAREPRANLALVSTPGAYAAAEAEKALRLGLHVMLFSDNIPFEEEIALKRLARKRGLLMMGPDCGTAIINGVPLGFANVVRPGDIGCVAASGTGLQQVTCLIDRLGGGISQAIGTGGRDLSAKIGGISMLQGIAALANDPATNVIVLISKPPSPEVSSIVVEAASRTGKPIVVNFLGADPCTLQAPNLYPAMTLEDAAHAAVALRNGRDPAPLDHRRQPHPPVPRPGAGRRYVRGLYSGGTFCYEASLLLTQALGKVQSTTPVDTHDHLDDLWAARGHTVIDLGDDVFTRGRPHPMIDHRLRNERLVREAADPDVAVILFDVVLGYGSHPDPAQEMAAALREARRKAPDLVLLGFVCGTEQDPQGLARQEARLREEGVVLADCNAAAARLAAAMLTQDAR